MLPPGDIRYFTSLNPMGLRDSIREVLFLLIYIPFALAAVVYLITGGAVGGESMVEAAFLPWWLFADW